MTIAQFALSEASLAEAADPKNGKKAPPKRTVQAVADQRLIPEPR